MRSMGVVFALVALACSSPTDPDSSAIRDETFVLRYGNTEQLGNDLRVSFVELVEDSRCPASVQCVWQGNGAIRLDVAAAGRSQSIKLNTVGGTTFPREATAEGYTFILMELDPQRATPDPVPPQQYRATIRVTRAQ